MSEAVLRDTLRGALRARAAAVGSALGVPDALRDGPRHVSELGGEPDTVRRYLRAPASDGIFEEVEPGVFANTEASPLLGHATAWGAFAQLFGGPFPMAVARLDADGGNGSFVLELFARTPGLRGIVFDLLEPVRDEAGLGAAGITFAEGSFFERVPSADTHVLGTVIHDWPDEDAAAILGTIAANAPSGARMLILDSVVQPGNGLQGGLVTCRSR